MKRIISIVLILALSISLFSACNTNEGSTTEGVAGEKEIKDTITLLVQSEPQTLDPAYANNDNITIILQFIYEDLFTLLPDGNIKSELAENVEIVDDTTIEFELKEGIKFSNGESATSEDVFFTIGRLQASPVSQSHFKFINLEESTIKDDRNFTLKLQQAWAPYSNTMSTGRGSIISKKAFEEMGEEKFARNPVGTGPYVIEEWVSGTEIKLTRNENYWQEPAKTKNIVVKFVEEPTARIIELETGAADIAYYIEGSDIERVNEIEGYHIEQGDSFRYFTIVLSMEEEYFKEQDVRYALAYAIDKDALVKASTMGVGTRISGYCPSVMEGYLEMDELGFDLDKAKELMKAAGYEDGFEIDLHVETDSIYQSIAEVVQSMWDKIGVKVNIVSSPLATYDAQKNGKFQASIRDGTATEISNVLIIYESSFGSRMNGNDDWLDAKLLELRTYYYGDAKRDEILKEITEYIHEIKYTYPFMVMPTIYAVSDKLEGFEFHPAQDHINPKSWVIYE